VSRGSLTGKLMGRRKAQALGQFCAGKRTRIQNPSTREAEAGGL
jgi:hypothetical protein